MINIMAENCSSAPLNPRDRLPKMSPRINLKPGRFWLLVEEFNGGVREISCDLERIKSFSFFAKIIMTVLDNLDLCMVTLTFLLKYLPFFLEKEFIDTEKCLKKFVLNFSLNFHYYKIEVGNQ